MNSGALVTMSNTSASECVKEPDVRSSRYDPLAPTVFHEDWWLETATGGNFDVAEVTSGGRTVGRLPFCIRKRLGLKMIHMPHLTYFLGPAIDEGEGSHNNRFLKRLEITRELIDKLPPAKSEYVKCHAGITEVIAFQEHGFRSYVQFTHEVSPRPVEALWQQMRDKTRNVIRRAEERLSIREMTDPGEFVQLFERNLALRGIQNDLDTTLSRKTIAASLERQRGRILAACDKNNQVVAANVCVWDETASYYLLSTRGSDAGNGAVSLLIWEAIKDSVRRNLVFDFAGLGTQGSILLYTGFGGAVSPRYVAVRMGPLARAVMGAKSLFKADNFYY
jgi:Acetyltransferase (GNAT) domain